MFILRMFLKNNVTPNIYIGHTTTTLSRHLTYHLSDISAIMKKHNKDTDKIKFLDKKNSN